MVAVFAFTVGLAQRFACFNSRWKRGRRQWGRWRQRTAGELKDERRNTVSAAVRIALTLALIIVAVASIVVTFMFNFALAVFLIARFLTRVFACVNIRCSRCRRRGRGRRGRRWERSGRQPVEVVFGLMQSAHLVAVVVTVPLALVIVSVEPQVVT